jgi:prepilin-type N-terminal cleavage/methylation domain-containing protein
VNNKANNKVNNLLINCQLRGQKAYSLIELLITLSLIAIVYSFAVPQWNLTLQSIRRSDATTALSRLANRQEQFRLQQLRYADETERVLTPPAGLGLISTDSGYYQLITSLHENGYQATATVNNQGVQQHDVRCWVFGIDGSGRRWAETIEGTDSTNDCWKT